MTDDDLERAARLWCSGKDTLDIGQIIGLAEHTVYSWLPVIRRIAREGAEKAVA